MTARVFWPLLYGFLILGSGTRPHGVAVASGIPGGAAAESTSQDSVDVLFDRVLEAYGGADRVRSVSSLRQDGVLVAMNGGGHGRVVRIATCPSDLSVLVQYPARTEIRITEGEISWRGESPADMVEVTGPMQGAMVLQAARTCLPAVLDAFRGTATMEAVEDRFILVGFDVANGLRLRVFISGDTHLPLRSESVLDLGGGTMTFASDYGDYREVDGLLVPFREESFAAGVHTASIRIETVEVNPMRERAVLPVPNG